MPFLSSEVTVDDDHIVWTTSGGLGAAEMAAMDAFFASADPTTSSTRLASHLEELGSVPVIVPTSPSSTRSV